VDFGFAGESAHTLDSKNRAFVPKRFQRELDQEPGENPTVILVRGMENCVYLFSLSGWRDFKKQFGGSHFGNPKRRAISRKFFSKAFELNLDSAGRVTVPEALVRFAGLEKDIMMVGVDDHAEIWNKPAWEAFEADNEELFQNLDEVLGAENPPLGA
jgi:MraZ protein